MSFFFHVVTQVQRSCRVDKHLSVWAFCINVKVEFEYVRQGVYFFLILRYYFLFSNCT